MRTTLRNRSFTVVLVGVMLVMGGLFGLAQAPDWPIIVPDGGAIRTRPFVGSTFLLQAYNTTTGLPTTLATFTAAATPTLDLAAGVTIGSAYLYRVGGTDVAVADGGTNKSSWTQYSIPYASATTTLGEIAPAASAILVTNGSNVPSLATDIPTAVTIGSAYIYRAGGTDVPLADGGTGASLADPNADRILFWDDNPGAMTWLAPGDSLAITTTTLDTIQDIRTSASPTFSGLRVGPAATYDGILVSPAVKGAGQFDLTLSTLDLTGAQAINFPNNSGTVALTADKLSAFAATTSAEFAGVISDETGSGVVVLDTAPSFASTVRVGAAATYDGIVVSPAVKGANQCDLTLSTLDLTAARAINFPDAAGTIITTGNLTSIVATGALDSGSITSNFGAINVGTDTISGGAGNFSALLTGLTANFYFNNNAGSGARFAYNGTNFPFVINALNSSGPAYIGWNASMKTGSDTATYTVTGFGATQITGNGEINFRFAASGTAGADITWATAATLSTAGLFSATAGYAVGATAGIDKTCTAAPTAMTVTKGIITAITCL